MMGDCFEASAKQIMDWDIAGYDLSNTRLVHGLVTGQGPVNSLRFTHAWLEVVESIGDWDMVVCHDVTNGHHQVIPQALYYKSGDIDPSETVAYTWEEARNRLVEQAHFGPWDSPVVDHKDPDPSVMDL